MGASLDRCCASERERPQALPPDEDELEMRSGRVRFEEEGSGEATGDMTTVQKVEVLRRASPEPPKETPARPEQTPEALGGAEEPSVAPAKPAGGLKGMSALKKGLKSGEVARIIDDKEAAEAADSKAAAGAPVHATKSVDLKERLVQGFRPLDAGCTGSVPRAVFEHVARAVCEVNLAWLEALERVLARTEGSTINYVDFFEQLYSHDLEVPSGAAQDSSAPGRGPDLKRLARQATQVTQATHGSRRESFDSSPRTVAVTDLFEVLDTDHGGVLSAQELLDLSYIRGLDISNWAEEWNSIVRDIGTDQVNGKEGLGLEKFTHLLASGKYKMETEAIVEKLEMLRWGHQTIVQENWLKVRTVKQLESMFAVARRDDRTETAGSGT